jgi:Flp pilus assembly pilin Flp
MRDALALLQRLFNEDDAQDMVEYSLLLAFFALGCVALLSGISSSVRSIISVANTDLSTATSSAS